MSTNDLSIETLLRAHAPHAPEHLRARVLALQPPATRPRFALPSCRLAHTDASLELRVDDSDALTQATTRATQIATSLGGYAKSVDYDTLAAGQGRSVIELRIPAQNVKA